MTSKSKKRALITAWSVVMVLIMLSGLAAAAPERTAQPRGASHGPILWQDEAEHTRRTGMRTGDKTEVHTPDRMRGATAGRMLAFLRSCGHIPSVPEPKVKKATSSEYRSLATKSINRFAVKLYAKLVTGDTNLVFSPFSLYSPLAMAFAGATGRTKDEMTAALEFRQVDVPLHATLGWLTHDLSSLVAADDGELSVANSIWAHKHPDYRIQEQFRETIDTNYAVKIREADFLKDPAGIVGEMNDWVKGKTRGRITDIVTLKDVRKDGSVEPGLILLDAIYFKCFWADRFKKARTKDKDFTLLDGSRVKTPMMHNLSEDYGYMEEATFQGLEMPYRGLHVAMVVFLPREVDGLEEFEKSLTPEKLTEWLGKLSKQSGSVDVEFPRFKMSSTLNLVDPLKAIGMQTAFDKNAKPLDLFSAIEEKRRADAPDFPLFIKDILQKAWIDVNEEGTEAAAATKVVFGRITGARPSPRVFRADHPFMFLIYHKESGCILFMGRVTKP